jgi:hypothetical protein
LPAGGLREIEKEESRGGRCVGGGRKACEKVEKITRATSLLAVQGAIVLVDARLHFIDITTEESEIEARMIKIFAKIEWKDTSKNPTGFTGSKNNEDIC